MLNIFDFPHNNQLCVLFSQVCVNIAVAALVSYAKVGAVVQLHSSQTDRDTALMLAGVVTQIGSLVGSLLFFVLVYYTDAFQSQ